MARKMAALTYFNLTDVFSQGNPWKWGGVFLFPKALVRCFHKATHLLLEHEYT